MPTSAAEKIRLERRIAADPTFSALLLAGPSALDLWPGLRRTGTVDGLVRAEAELTTQTATVLVKAEPPQRLPTSFVTRFAFTGSFESRHELPDTEGTITLAYAHDDEGRLETNAVIDLKISGEAAGTPAPYAGDDLRPLARVFLDNLAAAAEHRSHAA